MRFTWKIILTACLALLKVQAAAAQDPAVTVELARVVMTGFPFGGEEPPEILTGRLPNDLARILQIPASARIVGSISYPRHSFNLVALPADITDPLAEWVQRLENNGWEADPAGDEPGFQMGPIRPGARLCWGDSATIAIGPSDGPNGERYMHIFHITDRRFVNCPPIPQPMTRPESPIPTLTPPAGTMMLSGGGGGSTGEWHSTASLEAAQSPSDLLEHYAAQLRRAGWSVDEAQSARLTAMAPVVFTDQNGKRWYGMITVNADEASNDRIVSVLVRLAGSRM